MESPFQLQCHNKMLAGTRVQLKGEQARGTFLDARNRSLLGLPKVACVHRDKGSTNFPELDSPQVVPD